MSIKRSCKQIFRAMLSPFRPEVGSTAIPKVDEILADLAVLKHKQAQVEAYIKQVGLVPFRSIRMSCMSMHAAHTARAAEYKEKLARLFDGLDEDAAANLRAILERQERCATRDVISFDECFSGEDAEAWRKLQE
ncbi:MAG: hypothetical protein K2O70_09270, partial [Desulfovibrionaceae bacterium]|nr:hypothetical protein [Desulfovibrionaceae bacterium]